MTREQALREIKRRGGAIRWRSHTSKSGKVFRVAVGASALYNNTTGSNNFALGYKAGYNQTTGSSNIYIGNMGVAAENGMIYIGTVGVQTNTVIAGVITGNGSGLTNLTSVVQRGSTNATTLTAFTATFSQPFVDTNYTAVAIGNGFALAGSYVSSKTTTSCVFNMTVATGTIDWMAVHQ